jgi:hypothetical protein
MKKTLLSLSLTILFSLAVISSYAQKTEKRDVGNFTSVGLAISGELYLTQGSSFEVTLEGSEADLEHILTEVEGKTLKIKLTPKSYRTKGNVIVRVSLPEIEGLAVAGSGKVFAKGEINSDDLEIAVSGSGEVTMDNLIVDDLELAISGSGDVFLAGGADDAEIAISGSGDVKAEKFEIERCEIAISGSGSCRVNVEEDLEASISGSGKVYYRGNAKVDAHVSGSGKVESID